VRHVTTCVQVNRLSMYQQGPTKIFAKKICCLQWQTIQILQFTEASSQLVNLAVCSSVTVSYTELSILLTLQW